MCSKICFGWRFGGGGGLGRKKPYSPISDDFRSHCAGNSCVVTINNMAVPVLLQIHWLHSLRLRACRASPVSRCASSARKIRPLEKKLGRKPATPLNHKKKLQHILVPIVKIRPQLGYLELGRFLGRWLPRPQDILLGHFWVQRPWIRLSGTSLHGCLAAGLQTLGKTFRLAQYEQNLPMMKKTRQPEMPPFYI